MNIITTHNIHLHSAQEVFDFICTKVVEQGQAARNERGECAYRGHYDLKCAAGHLITDEDYQIIRVIRLGHEPGQISNFNDRVFQVLGWVKTDTKHGDWKDYAHADVAYRLQVAHDSAAAKYSMENYVDSLLAFVPLFKENARYVARMYVLNDKVVQS